MVAEQRREFNRIVSELSPAHADTVFRHGDWGNFARITNINGDDATTIEHRSSFETARTETSAGLAVEVFESNE